MGSFNSTQFSQMLEDAGLQTPPPETKTVTRVEFDPRSPTVGIDRTPIQFSEMIKEAEVQSTPEAKRVACLDFDPRSPTVGIDRTPIQFSEMIKEAEIQCTPEAKRVACLDFDPRSPTVGINRTPIQVEKLPSTLVDPRSPTVGISRTPIYDKHASAPRRHSISEDSPMQQISDLCIGQCNFEDASEEDEIVLPVVMSRSFSESDLTKDNIQLVPADTEVPEIEIPQALPEVEMVVKRVRPKVLFQNHPNIMSTQLSHRSPKDKQRSPLLILGDSNQKSSSGQRSPLGRRNVNYDSPRAIVQRKQANQLGLLKGKIMSPKKSLGGSPKKSLGGSPKKYDILYDQDKENISF